MAAISVGIVAGEPMLDLCFEEDSKAGVDLNLIMTGDGKIVEVQATAEDGAFSFEQLNQMMGLGQDGIRALMAKQAEAIARLGE